MSPSTKTEQLRAIKEAVVNLTISPLYTYRQAENNLPVIGEGSHEAKIMLIGEAPGKNEAKTGRPFCGAAGRLLDELLASINLPREKIYITNIIKDRPPQNRDPLPEEINIYGPFLDRQIEIIKPAIIATLGRYAMTYILAKFGVGDLGTISQLHGQVVVVEASYGPIKIVPLYHPAAAIYNQHLKSTLLADFKILTTV
ncbi:MAG: uracil-DNA glycosylase [bacterium]|nr:uracil-DNA glycosylase [bacterium]